MGPLLSKNFFFTHWPAGAGKKARKGADRRGPEGDSWGDKSLIGAMRGEKPFQKKHVLGLKGDGGTSSMNNFLGA